MEDQIILLYSCDEWKSNSKVIMATTSMDDLKKGIVHNIKEGNMVYTNSGNADFPIEESLKLFETDWDEKDARTINDRLMYGFFGAVTDGELF